jgi:hypothetical protein
MKNGELKKKKKRESIIKLESKEIKFEQKQVHMGKDHK